MKIILKTLLLIALTGLLSYLTACAPKSQQDCGFVQNVYGERISWKGKVPVVMKLHESVPKEYYSSIAEAAEKWNQALGKTVILVDTEDIQKGPTQSFKDTQNVVYFYNSWEAEKPTEQARTSVYWIGDEIKEADIRVNAKNFKFYGMTLQDKGPSKVSIEALLIHEMGHVLGLKHKDVDQSVMATYLASQSDRVSIAATDKKSLTCEY
ncbi:MAG: matrixin family metalloprotease [Bdellovibrionaceae bacterium]|nr:matrixin family metalloprotease [Pseudobdellovibrionaceae bacterium]